MDTFSKKTLSICGGISMVLIAASLFFISVKSSFASQPANNLKSFTPTMVSGKYMMSYQVFKYNDGTEGYNILVWDSETGAGKIYYYDKGEKKMKHWESGNIPASPM